MDNEEDDGEAHFGENQNLEKKTESPKKKGRRRLKKATAQLDEQLEDSILKKDISFTLKNPDFEVIYLNFFIVRRFLEKTFSTRLITD